MGNVIKEIDLSEFKEIVNNVNEHLEEEGQKVDTLTNSTSYSLMYYAKRYDDFFLDPIVGFIILALGDVISSITIIPALYIALFKLHSIKLTIAILATSILDIICGVIPIIGDIVDAFYKSNRIACRLIVGYVEEDEDIMSEINKRAVWGTILLIVIGFLSFQICSIIMSIYHWVASLF